MQPVGLGPGGLGAGQQRAHVGVGPHGERLEHGQRALPLELRLVEQGERPLPLLVARRASIGRHP